MGKSKVGLWIGMALLGVACGGSPDANTDLEGDARDSAAIEDDAALGMAQRVASGLGLGRYRHAVPGESTYQFEHGILGIDATSNDNAPIWNAKLESGSYAEWTHVPGEVASLAAIFGMGRYHMISQPPAGDAYEFENGAVQVNPYRTEGMPNGNGSFISAVESWGTAELPPMSGELVNAVLAFPLGKYKSWESMTPATSELVFERGSIAITEDPMTGESGVALVSVVDPKSGALNALTHEQAMAGIETYKSNHRLAGFDPSKMNTY